MDITSEIIFRFFSFLCFLILLIRNLYYFHLWELRHKIDNEKQYRELFPRSISKKLMTPNILENKKQLNPHLLRVLNKVNFYNYLFILSFLIAFFTLLFFIPIAPSVP